MPRETVTFKFRESLMDKMVAVVTGGTGGIGTAICERLAREYQVIACYFKQGKHEEAKPWQLKMQKAGLLIEVAYADITLFADCEALTNSILTRFGHVDVLVNNAGITHDSTLKRMDPTAWQKVIDANLTSVFNMTRNILPSMLEQKYGRIINIASINGRKGQIGQANYAASKAALYGFSKSVAQEVAGKGITVNTISPGYIQTPMLNALKKEVLDSIIASIPIGRLGRPQEIASAVAFLASQDAEFITGANLDINGGQYM